MEEKENVLFENALARKGTHRISLTPAPATLQHDRDMTTINAPTDTSHQPEFDTFNFKKGIFSWVPGTSHENNSSRSFAPNPERAQRPYSMTSLCAEMSTVPTTSSAHCTKNLFSPFPATCMTSSRPASLDCGRSEAQLQCLTCNNTSASLATVPTVNHIANSSSIFSLNNLQPSCNTTTPSTLETHTNRIHLMKPPVPDKLDPQPEMKTLEESQRYSKDCCKGEETWMCSEESNLWLSGSEPLPTKVREQFFESFEWRGKTVLEALRSLCSRLYLQGETNKIDRILESLSFRYVMCNPSSQFRAKECVHSVAYSLLLLNTDLHLAKLDQHMTLHQFVDNTSDALRETAFFDHIPAKVKHELEDMYISIRGQPLGIPEAMQPLIEPQPILFRTLSRGRGTISSLYRRQSTRQMERIPPTYDFYSGSKENISVSIQKRDVACLSSVMDSVVALDPKQNWTRRKYRAQFRVVLRDDTVTLYTKKSVFHSQEIPVRYFSLYQAWPKLCQNEQDTYMAITLADESVHLFYAPLPTIKKWTKTCLYVSARVSCIPLEEGSSNTDYGWLHVCTKDVRPLAFEATREKPGFWWRLFSRKGDASAEASIQTWLTPELSLSRSTLSLADQQTKMAAYVVYLKQTLLTLERIKEPMLLYWHMDRRAMAKALVNWDRKHDFFQAQLAKFSEYQEALRCCDDTPPLRKQLLPAQGDA